MYLNVLVPCFIMQVKEDMSLFKCSSWLLKNVEKKVYVLNIAGHVSCATIVFCILHCPLHKRMDKIKDSGFS